MNKLAERMVTLSNKVCLLNAQQLQQLISYYAQAKITRNAAGVVFAAKLPDTAITVYQSGKVLFQGSGALREAARWDTGELVENKNTSNRKGDTLPPHLDQLSVIGSDETGTGDFFGPVTVAACYVSAEQIELVRELGVKDSKQLTDAWMRKVAPDLKATLTHSVLTVTNEKYNEIQARGWSQGKIKALLHNQAIKHVLRKMGNEQPDYILIDQFAERTVYFNHLKSEQEIIRQHVLFSTKAENLHVAVAAASIIARVAFLEEMDRLSLVAGQPLPKGAGPKVDEVAAHILLTKGEAALQSMTKKHFANTKKAQRLADKKRSKK